MEMVEIDGIHPHAKATGLSAVFLVTKGNFHSI